MMNKLVWLFIVRMWLVWVGDYFYFRHQDERFTANHGQDLCLRVQAMDGKSCDYIKK